MAPRANKITTGFSFLRPWPLILGLDHMREEGVSRRGGHKSVWYRMAKNFTCMWGLESFPTTLVHQGKGKGQDGLTRTRRDQTAAWRDGGEFELSQMWTLCRTSSTSSPAEGTRSIVHNNRVLYSMGYMKPSRLWCWQVWAGSLHSR